MDALSILDLIHRYAFIWLAVTGAVVWTVVIVGGGAWAIVRLVRLFEERVE